MDKDQILILDNNDDTRKEICDIVEDILKSIDVDTDCLVCCVTIQEALDFVNTGKVGLVIVDASDAIQGQYSICSLIEANRTTQVILKAYVNELGPIKTAAVRVQGIIPKPVRVEDVKWHVLTALKIRKLHSEIEHIAKSISPGSGICSTCTVSGV